MILKFNCRTSDSPFIDVHWVSSSFSVYWKNSHPLFLLIITTISNIYIILLLILITVNYVLNLEIDFGFSYGHKYYITFYPTLKTNQFQGRQMWINFKGCKLVSQSVKNQMVMQTNYTVLYITLDSLYHNKQPQQESYKLKIKNTNKSIYIS